MTSGKFCFIFSAFIFIICMAHETCAESCPVPYGYDITNLIKYFRIIMIDCIDSSIIKLLLLDLNRGNLI